MASKKATHYWNAMTTAEAVLPQLRWPTSEHCHQNTKIQASCLLAWAAFVTCFAASRSVDIINMDRVQSDSA